MNLYKCSNGGGFRLDEPQQITLPYTAVRDCFICIGHGRVTEISYLYLYRNGSIFHPYEFVLNGNGGWSDHTWFPLKKGDTISVRRTNLSDYTVHVM